MISSIEYCVVTLWVLRCHSMNIALSHDESRFRVVSTFNTDHMFRAAGLENMDVLELEMRVRLAELQKKYKEKQRELARLQPRRNSEKE